MPGGATITVAGALFRGLRRAETHVERERGWRERQIGHLQDMMDTPEQR